MLTNGETLPSPEGDKRPAACGLRTPGKSLAADDQDSGERCLTRSAYHHTTAMPATNTGTATHLAAPGAIGVTIAITTPESNTPPSTIKNMRIGASV
jgi:hypothetical protein